MNGRIRAREVRVIHGETNEQLGIMKIQDALKKAAAFGMDLVEVAPTAEPPVCRIVDYGKFRYELAKHDKERKHSTAKVKEVKFRVNIDSHDYLTKIRRAESFLDKGNKLKVQLQFRGREMAHQDMGHDLMHKIKDDLNQISQVEMEPKQAGRSINMILAPLPQHKRKRRWSQDDEEIGEEEHEQDEEHDDEHED